MSKVKIIYGTVGGNTELVCQKAAEMMPSHEVELINAHGSTPDQLGEWDLLILACPTYGIGELEKHFAIYLRGLEALDLKGRKCAIIALGDPKYDKDYHLESAKIISDFLKRKEAEIVHMPLRISKNPLTLIKQGFVDRWAEKINEKM